MLTANLRESIFHGSNQTASEFLFQPHFSGTLSPGVGGGATASKSLFQAGFVGVRREAEGLGTVWVQGAEAFQ